MIVSPKKTFLDKLINYVDPVKGLQRSQARAMDAISGNYTGAGRKGASFKNWFPSSNDANADLLPDLPTLRSRCRDLVRNQPIAGGAINTVTTNVVGTGLTLQCSIDHEFLGLTPEQAREWHKNTEREFKLYSESANCDITRSQDFSGLQDLVFRSALENGDCFSLTPMKAVSGFPYKTRIQLIEGDRVCNKDNLPDTDKRAGGITVDDSGAPIKLHVLKSHPGGYSRNSKKWQEYDFYGKKSGRKNVIHLFDKRRVGQIRGVPYLSAVIEPLKQIGRYTEAELVAAVVSGLFTVIVKTEQGSGSMLGPDHIDNGASRQYELGNGTIVEGVIGDEFESIDPGRPNKEFDPFVTAILKQVGVALELPYEVLVKNFLSSYSASRAALLDAWKFFKKRRKWLANNFCQPVYEVWLAEAIALGRIDAPGFFLDPMVRKAYCGALWHGDGPGSIDPLKEANAVEKRLDIKLTSLAEEKSAYDGGDWEQTVQQRNKEIEITGISDEEPVHVVEPFDPDNPQ